MKNILYYLISFSIFFSMTISAECLKEGSFVELKGHVYIKKSTPDEDGDGSTRATYVYIFFKPEVEASSICVIGYEGKEEPLDQEIQLIAPQEKNFNYKKYVDLKQLVTVSGLFYFADGSPSMISPQLLTDYLIQK